MTAPPPDGSQAPDEAAPVVPARRPPGIAGLASGAYLDPERAADAQRCLVVAVEHASGQVDALADRLADLQAARGDFQPIVVVRSSATRRLRRHGFLYERVMPPSQWGRVAAPDTYDEYVSRRLRGIRDMYQPHARVDLPGGAELTAEDLERALGRGRGPHGAADEAGR